MKYSHVIFDLDGTLIDTELAVTKTWQFTLRQYGYSYGLEELKAVLGLPIPNTLKKLGVSVDPSFDAEWMKNYGRFSVEADFFEGCREMLAELKQHGVSLGIVTSRCQEEYDRYFRSFHLENIFDCIICADDTDRHKPDPEPLFTYTQKAGVDRSACIYVGDMPTDMECAQNAGIASGFAAWNHSGKQYDKADFVFRSPQDLLQALL